MRRLILLGFIVLFAAPRAIGAKTGGLKLDVLGGSGTGTKAGVTAYPLL